MAVAVEVDAVSAADFSSYLEERDEYRSQMHRFMKNYDAILCPAVAFPAPEHGGTMEEGMDKGFNTGPYNVTGWPGAVVRCGTAPGDLPIGLQVVARPWREDVALALAGRLETALGGWQPPDI